MKFGFVRSLRGSVWCLHFAVRRRTWIITLMCSVETAVNVITTQNSDEFAQLYSYLKKDLDKDPSLSAKIILAIPSSFSKSFRIKHQYFLHCSLEFLNLIGQLWHLTVRYFLILPNIHGNRVYNWNQRYFHVSHITPQAHSSFPTNCTDTILCLNYQLWWK